MKTAFVAVCLLGFLGVTESFAADLKQAAPAARWQSAVTTVPNWAGPYLGVQAGYLAGRGETTFPGAAGFHFLDPKGFAGGLMAGYGLQWGRIVAGLEADLNLVAASDGADTGLPPDPSATRLESRIDWNGHLRGRVGYAFDRLMVFAAGGLAVAGVENKAIDNVAGATATWKDTRVGWTLGGGVDFRVAPAMTVRLEYLYDHYGAKTLAAQTVGGVAFAEREQKLDSHMLRAGVNWRF